MNTSHPDTHMTFKDNVNVIIASIIVLLIMILVGFMGYYLRDFQKSELKSEYDRNPHKVILPVAQPKQPIQEGKV